MRESRTSLVILGVLDKVILQDPHQDGRQEARQQQHRHTAVDDREPVNLHQHINLIRPLLIVCCSSTVTSDRSSPYSPSLS